MEWVKVKNAGTTGERLLRADAVIEVQIKSQSVAILKDARGNTYEWQSTGTMAEYAKLISALGIADPA